MTETTATQALKHYARRAVVGYIVLLIGVGVALYGVRSALNDSKERGATVRNVICLILQQADQFDYAAFNEHKINSTELVAGLHVTARYRQEIGTGYDRKSVPSCFDKITPESKLAH
jgi:hypothetical protein